MRFLCAVIALLLAVGVSSALAAPRPVKNTCALAPATEASDALKTPVKVGVEIDGMCLYNNAKGTTVLTLAASSLDTAALAGTTFQYAGKQSVKPVEVVSGVVDEAEITYSNSGPVTLVVRKGTTIVQVSILPAIGSNLPGYKAGMIQIAKAALGRL